MEPVVENLDEERDLEEQARIDAASIYHKKMLTFVLIFMWVPCIMWILLLFCCRSKPLRVEILP
jgi:hypothetical protein